MCMIINNAIGSKLDSATIASILAMNPDGVGFYDLTTGELRKTMDYNTAFAWLESETPYVAHCRYATKGETTLDNVHPFPLDENHLLMMNGTIDGYVDDDASDTRQLVNQLQYVKPDNVLEFLACFSSRFCIIDTSNNTVETVGKWTKREGVEFSNNRPFETTTKCVPTIDGNLVAVYGTLKFGYCNHEAYLAESPFIDYALTSEPYRLCVEGLPYLLRGVDYDKGDFIEVEVYAVTDEVLGALDKLEGHPHYYRRETIEVELEKGGTVDVIVYMVDETFDTGDYVAYYHDDDAITEGYDGEELDPHTRELEAIEDYRATGAGWPEDVNDYYAG